MLAKLRPDSEELSLCFDPKSDVVGAQDEGDRLFEDGKPSQVTQNVLGFCEQFEQAAQRTAQFMEELKSYDLLMDGRSEEHTSELQSLMRISYAVFCFKKKQKINHKN